MILLHWFTWHYMRLLFQKYLDLLNFKQACRLYRLFTIIMIQPLLCLLQLTGTKSAHRLKLLWYCVLLIIFVAFDNLLHGVNFQQMRFCGHGTLSRLKSFWRLPNWVFWTSMVPCGTWLHLSLREIRANLDCNFL